VNILLRFIRQRPERAELWDVQEDHSKIQIFELVRKPRRGCRLPEGHTIRVIAGLVAKT
jgi:hypothetical protein